MKFIYLKIILVLLIGVDLFASAVATMTALRGEVGVERQQESLGATLGMKLLERDHVVTKDNSKAQLIFKDDTVISVGKKTNFSIEEYLFDDNSAPVAKFNMLHGAMRTITGKIGKIAPHKFNVATKTATIGIRGTNFTIIAGIDGSIYAYCTYGTITLSFNNQLYDIEQGYYISVLPSGEVDIKEFTAKSLKEMRKRYFGIVVEDDSIATKEHQSQTTAQSEETAGSQTQTTTTTQSTTTADNQTQTTTDDTASTPYIEASYADDGKVVARNVQEITTDNILNDNMLNDEESHYHKPQYNPQTPAEVINGYQMENAVYTGRYTAVGTGNSYGTMLVSSGTSKLALDFYNDKAILELTGDGKTASPGYPVTPCATYDLSVTSNTMEGPRVYDKSSLQPVLDGGTANGTFLGTNGEQVEGTFTYGDHYYGGITDSGSYNAVTSQALR